MTALVAVGGVVLVLLCVLVAGLLRSHATILRRMDELGADPDAADRRSSAPSPAGGRVDEDAGR